MSALSSKTSIFYVCKWHDIYSMALWSSSKSQLHRENIQYSCIHSFIQNYPTISLSLYHIKKQDRESFTSSPISLFLCYSVICLVKFQCLLSVNYVLPNEDTCSPVQPSFSASHQIWTSSSFHSVTASCNLCCDCSAISVYKYLYDQRVEFPKSQMCSLNNSYKYSGNFIHVQNEQ